MSDKEISVTEASRNFADCVNRARYQGMSFILHKNGVPVARIVPEDTTKASTGRELAATLRESLKDVRLAAEEATGWLHDLELARRTASQPGTKWQY